MIGAIALPASG